MSAMIDLVGPILTQKELRSFLAQISNLPDSPEPTAALRSGHHHYRDGDDDRRHRQGHRVRVRIVESTLTDGDAFSARRRVR